MTYSELEPLPSRVVERVGASLGVVRWIDLALHLPLRHQDEASLTPMHELVEGVLLSVIGTVTHSEVQDKPRKQWVVTIADESGELSLRWLHFYPSQIQKISVGMSLKATGQVRRTRFAIEMVHPKIQLRLAEEENTSTTASTMSPNAKLTPVYPTTAGVKQSDWQRWISLLPQACFEDLLPAVAHIMPWGEALRTLHSDASVDTLNALNMRMHPAWQRIKFDEILAQQLALQAARAARKQWRSTPYPINAAGSTPLIEHLPFTLTLAQQTAWQEIARDLAQTRPMQRLLQGDVGSGKTVVAALACAHVASQGAQAAIMAPTEILAEQHFSKLQGLFTQVGLRCGKLIGSMSKKDKQAVCEQIAKHTLDVVIGTHALIQDAVQFASLALVVVDEQHRFGVKQRLTLLKAHENELIPHQLMMSATPIPRTLAQTYLSDLDISVLDEKPPGRQAIVTKLLAQTRREELIESLNLEAARGQQVYWVCPLIEENEELQLQAAEQSHQELTQALPNLSIALLHGKMNTADKARVMAQFIENKIHVLVSTTVIEVGVDVPNATLMVIEHAERFGLAQLHQLRGRVGRGHQQSVCVLLYGSPLSYTGKQRLKALHESEDGFYLAEKDLQIRGPGELLGQRQSGIPLLKFANPLEDMALFKTAKSIASTIDAAQTPWAQRLIQRWFGQQAWWLA